MDVEGVVEREDGGEARVPEGDLIWGDHRGTGKQMGVSTKSRRRSWSISFSCKVAFWECRDRKLEISSPLLVEKLKACISAGACIFSPTTVKMKKPADADQD